MSVQNHGSHSEAILRLQPLTTASLPPPAYCTTLYCLSSFPRWLIPNGRLVHAYWLQLAAEAVRLGLPLMDCDVETFAIQEYQREFEDSLSLSPGDDPDEDGEDEGVAL